MTENKMFCFQCQETAKGTGCTIKGVCGKEAETSRFVAQRCTWCGNYPTYAGGKCIKRSCRLPRRCIVLNDY